jgi:hypothetical protein
LDWENVGGEGHAGVDGLGGGKRAVREEGGGTEPKSETEPPSLGFAEPNVGGVVFR